jgi:hypothetical protein
MQAAASRIEAGQSRPSAGISQSVPKTPSPFGRRFQRLAVGVRTLPPSTGRDEEDAPAALFPSYKNYSDGVLGNQTSLAL